MATPPPILGAIIAGGSARRFGSDKGAALLHGVALINYVAAALRPQVAHVIIVGRDWAELESIPDYPAPDLGPLGGLNAALRYACAHGYAAVLTIGCDTMPVPPDLGLLLSNAPAVIANHYLFGYWPTTLADALDSHLADQTDRSMRHWMRVSGAREVAAPCPLHNLNTPTDLAAYAASSS